MITLILSVAVFCFLMDAEANWMHKRTARAAGKGVGCVIASGVLLMALFSIVETHPVGTSWAFRTGELVPQRTENEEGQPAFAVIYRQKSWWRWKTDGEWVAMLDKDGEWVFEKGAKWQPVPQEVYISYIDDRAMEVDNRGSHEQ